MVSYTASTLQLLTVHPASADKSEGSDIDFFEFVVFFRDIWIVGRMENVPMHISMYVSWNPQKYPTFLELDTF